MSTLGQKVSQFFKKGRDDTGIPLSLARKASAVGKLLANGPQAAFIGFSAPRWTGRSYEKLVREGYCKNVVVHRCVRIISESAASVPFILYRGDKRLERHPVLDLLTRPNPLQSGKEMLANFYAYQEIAGNSYLEAVEAADGSAAELYVLRPERVKIIPGPNGWPARFEYKVGAKVHSFVVNAKTGKSPILQLRNFHPENDHYGLSPLEPSAYSVYAPFNITNEKFLIADWALQFTKDDDQNLGFLIRETLIQEDDSIYDWNEIVDEIDVPISDKAPSGKKINDQRAIPPVNVGGGMVAVASNPLSAVDAGATARIDIAQHTRQYGFGTVTYNAGSITGLGFSTLYYIIADDPLLQGGNVTYLSTTSKTTVTDGNDRIFIGEVTTPADGESSTTGSGGGGLLGGGSVQ